MTNVTENYYRSLAPNDFYLFQHLSRLHYPHRRRRVDNCETEAQLPGCGILWYWTTKMFPMVRRMLQLCFFLCWDVAEILLYVCNKSLELFMYCFFYRQLENYFLDDTRTYEFFNHYKFKVLIKQHFTRTNCSVLLIRQFYIAY